FDDLDPLKAEPGVALQFIRKGDPFPEKVDMIVLPGSKSTISDMVELRANGWEQPIKDFAASGGLVIGVCGGYQILGKRISDPKGLEGDIPEIEGLGLLNVETDLLPEKTVQNFEPVSCEIGCELTGYEIHMVYSDGPDCSRPMVNFDGRFDGAISQAGNVRGCYLHGLFNADVYRKALLKEQGFEADETLSYRENVETALDELAEAMEEYLDVDGLLALATEI
ncbi:MAG: cobyric acid synthase CobQ, partial [Pseudomonadota bacterium]